ncbi:hypothetical protein Tco_0196308 [Tanacetum coccineum]
MGETLILNKSLDPTYGDYIELNDLNEPLELRGNQVEDLGPTIEEGEIIDEAIEDIVETRNDDNKICNGIDEYPSFCDVDRKIHLWKTWMLTEIKTWKLFKTPSLDYSSSPEFDLFSNHEDQSEEEVAEAMGEPTMEEYMIKTREDYGSEVILFYKGLDVPTRQILDSKGTIPSMKAADAKKAIKDIGFNSQNVYGTLLGARSRLIDDCYEENKALKSLLMNKPRLGCQIETSMNVHDSAILEDSLPLKEKDPGSAGDLGVATPRAWVYAVVMTSTGMLCHWCVANQVRQAYLVVQTMCLEPEDLRETEIPQPLPSAPSLAPPSDDPYLIVRQTHTPTTIDIESEPEEAPSKTWEFKILLRDTIIIIISDPSHSEEVQGPGSEEEEAAPEGQQQAVSAKDTAVDEPLGLGYGALRRRELVVGEGEMPSMFEVGHGSRFMPEHEGVERISAFRQPTLVTWVDHEDGRVYIDIPTYVPPVAPEFRAGAGEGYGDIQCYMEAGISFRGMGRENHDLRMQIAEERRERLELTDRVARMERRQESRGDCHVEPLRWKNAELGHIPLEGLNPLNRTTKGLDIVECFKSFVVVSRTGTYPDTRPNRYEEKEELSGLMNSEKFATYLKRVFMERPIMGYQIKASLNVHDSTILEDSLPLKEKDPEILGIDKFVFPVDFVLLDIPEDIKVPLILERPFLSTALAKINVFKNNYFKTRIMGEDLVLNRSLDPVYGDFIELNEPLELRRNQVEDLGPTIEDGEVINKPMVDIVKTRNDDEEIEGIDEYPIVENMDTYRDEGIGDVIVGKPFCKEICVKSWQFDRMITIYNGNDSVSYQMLSGIWHPYQKLKSFYKGVLNLGPEYIRDAKIEELLTRGHVSMHEME